MMDNLGQTREDLDDVETLNNARDEIESVNDSKDDDLMYSAGTGTLGNSSLNFGFSTGNKSFFQNNLTNKATKMNQQHQDLLKAQLDQNLNISNISDIK